MTQEGIYLISDQSSRTTAHVEPTTLYQLDVL